MALSARSLPAPATLAQYRLVEIDVDALRRRIDDQAIAFLDQCNGPADRGLGRDVPDDESVTAAGESAIRDQCHRLAETLAHDRACRAQHLAHARPADRPLVAHHQNVARLHIAVQDGMALPTGQGQDGPGRRAPDPR